MNRYASLERRLWIERRFARETKKSLIFSRETASPRDTLRLEIWALPDLAIWLGSFIK